MIYDLLSPGGQHLIVRQDTIQNKTESKKICSVRGWASAEANYENVAILYSHLTSLLEEGTIKVSTYCATYTILAFDVSYSCSRSQPEWR